MKWLTALALVLLGACIQLPTEKQEVADLRPQISFSFADPADEPGAYQVFVDGLDMGKAEAYVAGRNALKVLSGTHLIRIDRDGRSVLQQQVYLGDGATKTFLLTKP